GGNFVKVNFANEYGCTALTPTNYTVTVLAQPVPVISGLDSVCEGTTGVQYTTQAGMSNYQWHVSAGGTITSGGTYSDNKVTITWNTAGTQYVYVDYTDGNGCTAINETVFPVRVLPLPIPTIFGNDYICAGTANVIYSTEYGKSNYVWYVSAGGTITAGGTSTDNTISITWNTPGSQTVSVNYTNGSGCVASTPTVYNVIVNPLPTPTISGNNNVCAGTTGVVYTTQAGMIDYIWQVSSGGTITSGGTLSDNTVTVTWNTAGPQTVKVNYKYPTGCDADSSTVYNVTVNPRPVPTVIGPSPVCLNSTGNGYTTESGMSNYIWSVSAGGTITAGGTSTNNNITITWKTAGLQTVSVNYTDGNGCTASTSTVNNVIVNSLPTPVITGPATACINSTGNVYSTTPGMSNYVWTGSAGAIITTGGTSTDNTITITWNTIGNHTVSVNYTDANGCTASSATVYDITVNPIPVADVTGPATACLNSAGNVYTATPGMTSYVWIVSAGGTIVAGGTTTDNTVTVRWDAVGPQSVSLNCTKGSCASTQPTVYAVTVNPRAVPVILGSPTACPGPSSDPLYSTDAGMSGYQWNISAGGTIISGGGVNNNSIEVEWNTLGTQWVKVNYTDGNGCNAANPVVYYIHVGSPTIDSGLVAYFPFNGNAKDMSGHGNDATVFGATLTKDRFGNENSAYSFNGVDNYMRILQSSSLRNLSTATFSYWVKYQVASGQIASTISNGPDHNTYNEDGFYTYAGSTGIQHNLGHWGGTIKTARVGYDALKALNYQSFTLVTIVIDSNYIRSYRNGVLQQTTQRAGLNISRTDLDWYLGQSGLNTYFMNGILDDIRIYNRAISDCEITELYDINKCEVVINSYRNSKLCANAPNLLVAGGCKTYSWSTGETKPDIQVIPTSVTTYTVTGTNGACTATSSLVVIPVSSHPDQGLALSLPIEGWVTDVSGNANKVVVYGGTQLVADRFGNPKSAIKLDGTSGYIRIAQSPSLNNLVNATFTYWLKYETTPGKVATTLTNGPDNVSERGFYNYAYENRITYTLGKYYDPANVTSTLPIDGSVKPNKEFSFVAVVIDDDSIRTYLDAKCMSSVARNGMPISRPSQDWLIGQSGSNTMFLNGTIDDIRIYNRALNSCEIVALRNYNKCGITMNGVPVTVCKGYPVTLTSSGGATYSWSTGKVGAVQTVHPTVTTKYFVTITQLTGCRAVDSYLVNVVNCNEEAENSVEGIKTVTSQDGTTSLNVYPNPFNDLSNISFTIPTDQKVVLNVYNLLGNKVAILMNEQKVAGSYVAEFNKNDLTPGVYFIEMKAGETTIQKRVVIL
ncbi:MAG: LamG-like jellyroll fold domain-containing protein, partial [Bacteroidota bacterium]|nr:LamG-like jellyroll fold domain-containing protein [Bacteroidota bacterium]